MIIKSLSQSSVLLTILMLLIPNAYAQEFQLERLLDEAKSALLLVEQEAVAQSLPRLDTVTLELNVTQGAKVGGKISFFIVSFGKEKNTEITNSVKLVLAPPPADSGSNVANVGLAQALADSILAGAYAINTAVRGLPPLYPKELTTTINFVLTTDGSGGFKLEFPPFSAGISGADSAKFVQKITVTYKVV